MVNRFSLGHCTESEISFYCRKKFVILPSGARKLISAQKMSYPCFRLPGFEPSQNRCRSPDPPVNPECAEDVLLSVPAGSEDDIRRARHRSALRAMDLILANYDLDAFVTLTVSPGSVSDRSDWESVYHEKLASWLRNRCYRNGLKYVMCSERHKQSEGLHFHALCNSSALKLSPAISAKTGRPIFDRGQQVFNVSDWSDIGFSTCKLVRPDETDRSKVSKYILKYLIKGKEKIGGRYFLHGGDLKEPVFEYSNDFDDLPESTNYFEFDVQQIHYEEWSFI